MQPGRQATAWPARVLGAAAFLTLMSACDPAQAATRCILDAASAEELRLLARDVGVEAGTATKATIRTIALRPAAGACFAANAVPALAGAL
jgi:hypothetical protein